MAESFIKIPKIFFQEEKNKEGDITQQSIIDVVGVKGFVLYCVLAKRMTKFNESYISISEIYKEMRLQSRDKKKVLSALEYFKEVNLIDFKVDIHSLQTSQTIELEMDNNYKFLKVYKDEFELYKLLSNSTFSIYFLLRTFVNKDKKYAFVSYTKMHNITKLSRTTISKSVTELYKLGIFNAGQKGNGWQYSDDLNRFIRSNNKYFLDVTRRREITSMTKEEVHELLLSIELDKEKTNEREVF